MPISSKDKLRVNLAAKRVERWNRERCKPAHNPVDKHGDRVQCRLRGIVFDADQDKPALVYADKGVVSSHVVKVNPKAYNSFVRRGDSFADYQDADYSDKPRDPAYKAREYKARPNSPFKRAQASAASVVIVRK